MSSPSRPPRVSICLPNLNTRRYLPARLQSIFDQDFTDWELIVYDSFSDDGSWEYIQELGNGDPRVHAFQGPREGIYPAWNRCLDRAAGEFVYIATSDDTMATDCLSKLVAALDAEPDCGLAHCRVKFIDADGHDAADWFTAGSSFATAVPGLMDVRHVRLAPLDGLLHLAGYSVYFSITQLLIRRTVFDRVGRFDDRWGTVSDFNWNMRAALTHNTVHVPDTWGGWRVHQEQASAQLDPYGAEYRRRMQDMMDDALQRCAPLLPERVRAALPGRWRAYHWQRQRLRDDLGRRSWVGRIAKLLATALGGSVPARDELRARLRVRRRKPLVLASVIRRWATRVVGHDLIRPSRG